MARKYGIITACILAATILLAIITHFSLTQRDADIYTKRFHFIGVFSVGLVPTEEELDEELEESTSILVVRPTEEIEDNGYIVLQKVEITKVLKGEEKVSEQIWVSNMSGIYKDENWGAYNLMYPEYEYLVCVEKLGKEYHEKLWIGPIRLDNSTDCKPLDETKEYCYAELKEYKYFAESEEVLELLYECERYVLEKVGLK